MKNTTATTPDSTAMTMRILKIANLAIWATVGCAAIGYVGYVVGKALL